MNDLLTSFIRTVVPVVVGGIVSYLTTKGVNVDREAATGLATFLTGLVAAVYYLAARILESKYPKAGNLLGVAKQPVYVQPVEPVNISTPIPPVDVNNPPILSTKETNQ